MNVLGIETSCDETAAAVVCDGRKVLSNVVFSQTALHGPYGGVVPEIASRSHVERLPGIVEEAVSGSGLEWSGIDAIAFTYGPGLASSLLVGMSVAKGLSLALDKPLCAVNHLHAHIYSIFLGEDAPRPEEVCPFTALVVSGGHTCIVSVEKLGAYKLLGSTIDDAAGEAFDKGANVLGLGYPGGPAIEVAARDGDPAYVRFPRGRQKKEKGVPGGLSPELCFSFSGVKTSLLYYLKKNPLSEDRSELGSIAASYQEAIVDALVTRCDKAIEGQQHLAVAGGVALNSRLRERLGELAAEKGIRLLLCEKKYCADNAAMTAGLAGAGQGIRGEEAMGIDAQPSLGMG